MKEPRTVQLQDLKIGADFMVEGTIVGPIYRDSNRIKVVFDGDPIGIDANLHFCTVVIDLETKSPNFRRGAKDGE